LSSPFPSQEPSGRLIERGSWFALALVLSCAIGVRFYGIDHLPGINGDEPQYAVHAARWFDGTPFASLRTGTGLLLDPAFFGTVVLVQGLLPASLWSLRLAAVIQSLLAIGLAYALFRRRGRMFAATLAVLVAVLPVHLGYARFAWTPTAIPTVVVLALAMATRLRFIPTVMAFLLALWVHPTTAFTLPVLAAPFVVSLKQPRGGGPPRWPSRRMAGAAALALVAVVTTLVGLGAVNLLPDWVRSIASPDLAARMAERASRPAALLQFFAAYVDLLSGATMFRYVPAALSDAAGTGHLAAGLALVLPLGVAGTRRLSREGRTTDLAVAGGLCLAIVGAYLAGGSGVLAPKTERYGLCLTIPGCFVLASWVDVLASTRRRAAAYRVGLAAVGALLILSFVVNYLVALHSPARRRENTFRTGPLDPKRRAVEIIQGMRDPNRTTLVYAQDWWIYWTLRYLAPPETGLRITIYRQRWDARFPPDFVLSRYDPARMERFAVAWAGRSLDTQLAKESAEHVDVHGYEPGPILRVRRLSPRD
jgi:hypothetical protein